MAASFRVDLIGACEKIREEAENLAGQNYGFNLQRKTGALDFITSPENMQGVDTELITWDAGRKVGQLRVLYDQRTKPCEIGSNSASVCNTGSEPVRKQFTQDIDHYVHTPVRTFTNADMVVLCKDTGDFIKTRLFSDLRAAREFLSTRLLAFYDSQVGKNFAWSGTNINAGQYKELQLLLTSNGQRIPQPGNYAEMIEDFRHNQLTGPMGVIGEGNYAMFARLHGMSCCNSTTPYGDAAITDSAFYLDQAGNNVLGNSKVVTVAYGATHFATFNENRNVNINTQETQNIVIPDPAGYPFDWNLDFYWDKCAKAWKFMYSLHWTAFNIFQNDSFGASGEGDSPDTSPDCTDDLDGMTGVFGYHITNG